LSIIFGVCLGCETHKTTSRRIKVFANGQLELGLGLGRYQLAERMQNDSTLERLEDQICWYDRKSRRNEQIFKVLKVVVIASAALIPLLSGLKVLPWVVGSLGVLIALMEGLQQLNQYQNHWTSYRSTCEYLKHEKYLYLAKAGPYASTVDPHALLAERVESLVSQEHAKWISSQEKLAVQTKMTEGSH
jgi:hypothetical protein